MTDQNFQESLTNESRYRLLIDAITDYAIYMLNREGFVTSWNPGAQRFKGYSAGEIIGRHFSTFYTEAEREAGAPAAALEIAAREGRFEREGWRIRKDGSRFWAHVVIDPIRAPSGELMGFAKITRDLTERRAAENALRASQEQFRLLVQGVTDYAIYMLDADGRLTNWNAGAQRIKGYAPEEVIGQHFSKFYTEEDRKSGLPTFGLSTAAREGRWEQEGWRVRKDGSRFWAHVIIDAIHDDAGTLLGFAKITRDITERREAQRALDVAREALFQSQKLEAIGQLTGGIAHDFNNLLMAVLGSLELVRKRLPYDPKITPLLENAHQGAQRGAVLTQRMLAFARRQELRLEAVDVAALVQGMQSFVQRTIGSAILIETDLPPELPKVRTDAAQLESAILNLAVNARDAMPDGGQIAISATIERCEQTVAGLAAGDYLRLVVRDTGEGMDQETVGRAAEPFFTTKGVGRGTGLGLSMVHGLAAQSGGAMRIQSAQSEGTSVELWLPIDTGDDAARPERPNPSRSAGHPARSLLVLAVDDDPLVLMNTAAMLEDIGHRVLQAVSGEEAMRAIAAHPDLDLVVTDQVMPGVTGLQLAEQARALRADLPVIIATGYAETPAGAGLDLQRLIKPFTQAELDAAVTRVMGPERAVQAAAEPA